MAGSDKDAAGAARWLLPLVIGFLAGVPAGAFFFAAPAAPRAAAVDVAEPAPVSASSTAAPAVEPAVVAAAAPAPSLAQPRAAAPAAAVATTPGTQPPSAAGTPGARPAVAVRAAGEVAAAQPTQPAAAATARTPAAVGGGQDTDPALDAELDKLVGGPSTTPSLTVDEVIAAEKARSVDSLLDGALSPAARDAELSRRTQAKQDRALSPADADANLPNAPSRDDVSNAMAVLVPAIRGCAMGQAGMATAGIVVSNDGKVASVTVTGAPFAGSASGRCMEGVVRRARFPRFKQPAFRVQFPFAIQ